MADVTEKIIFELVGTGAFKTVADDIGKISAAINTAKEDLKGLSGAISGFEGGSINVPTINMGTSNIDTGGLGGIAPGARAASQALGDMNYEAGRTSQAMNEVNYNTGKTVTQFRDMDSTVGEAGNSLANQRYALYDAADAFGYLATMATAAYASTAGVAIMFEEQFSQVHRTADLVGSEVGAMKEELIDLTREIPASFGNLADVAAIGGQIGIAKDDIVEFTRVVTMMATTTDVTLEESALLFGRFQTLLGTTTDEFEALGSAILEVGVDSAAGEAEIAKMSIELAAVASQAGLTEVQLIALTGTLASAGIPAERGRSAVQNSFDLMDRAIRDNGEELQKWAALAGVSADEFAASWGTTDFFGMFKRSVEGLAQAGSSAGAVLDDLGVRNARTRTGLQSLASAVDLLDKTVALSTDGWDQALALQEHFGIAADTVASRMILLKNEVMALMDQLGRGFVDTGVFTGAMTVLGNALWFVTEIIERVPLASWFSTAASAGLLVVSAMATFKRISALVAANSFALADSQKAMSKGFSGTREASQSLLSSLFSLNGAQKDAVVAEKVAVTSKELLMAATLQQRVATQLATAEQQKYNAVILGNDAAFQKASAAIAMHEKNLVKANAAVDAAKIKNDQLNASLVTQATAAKSAATAQTTAATSASWFATKLTGLKDGLLNVGKSLLRMAPQLLIFTAAGAGINLAIGALRHFTTGAEEGGRKIEGLNAALAEDTKQWEESGEAVALYAVAMDKTGKTVRTDIELVNENTDATALLAEAKSQLGWETGVLAQAAAEATGAQADLGDEVEVATEQIYSQIVAIDKAVLALMRKDFLENPLDGPTKLFPEINDENWAQVIVQWEAMAKAGDEGAISMERLTAASLDLDGETAKEVAAEIDGIYNAVEAAHTELYNFIETQKDDGSEEWAEKHAELQENLDKTSEAYNRASFASALLNKMNADFTGPIFEMGADEIIEGAQNAYYEIKNTEGAMQDYQVSIGGVYYASADAADAHFALADAMFAFGSSLAVNGTNFDIYTQSGRANMEALSAAVEAAVIDANGDAIKLAENIGVINAAMVANGMDAVEVLNMVMGIVGNVKNALGMDFSIPQLGVDLKRVAPAIDTFGLSLNEGYTQAKARADRQGRNRGAADGAKRLGDEAEKAAKEIRTLSDYVSDLSSVMSNAFDFRWGHMQQLDDTADAWQSINDWAESAAEAIKDARDELRDAKDAIRDIKNEIKGIDADLAELKAQESVLEFQLKVAIDYGDELRAKQIEAELLGNRAEQSEVGAKRSDAKRDLDEGERDLTDATKKLSEAQQDAQRDLTGTTESAREQRDMVWDLLESYQKQIETYANTGASTQDLEQYSKRLRSEFEDQLRQLGYNQTEVKNYSVTFEDLTKVIQNVPRNITVSINNNPALRALDEYRAGLSKTDSSLKNTRGEADRLSDAIDVFQGLDLSGPRREFDTFSESIGDAADAIQKLIDESNKDPFKNIGGGSKSVGSSLFSGIVFPGFAKGGLVPDKDGIFGFQPQGTDTVPAMLTPGEYVIPRNVVNAIGTPFFDALRNNRGTVPVTGNTYIHQGGAPSVQLVELMPHQFNSMVTAVSRNVGQAMASGADLSVATTRANNRAVRAGAN